MSKPVMHLLTEKGLRYAPLCRKYLLSFDGSDSWRDVTCKRCLKLRKRKKAKKS